VLDGAVEGDLARSEKRVHEFTVTSAPRAWYVLELFAKGPADRRGCTAASGVDISVIDKDDALVTDDAMGNAEGMQTSDADAWTRKGARYFLRPGTYRARVTAHKWCSVSYRVRLVRA
jgi:hypothetical protein